METWLAGVTRLEGFSRAFPQTDYSSLTMPLHQEWQFLQSVIPGFGSVFETLGASFRHNLILSLVGGSKEYFTSLT